MSAINCRKLRKKIKKVYANNLKFPKDHHSLLQLYLDGPRNKLFNIFSLDEKLSSKLYTKKYQINLIILTIKSLTNIRNAQKDAIIESLKLKKIPFRSLKLKN